MRLIKEEDFKREVFTNRNKYLVFDSLDIRSNSFTELLKLGLTVNYNFVIYSKLNLINNQGITKIDLDAGYYYIGKNKYALSELSNSEKVFLIAILANLTDMHVAFYNCISSLTSTTFQMFIKVCKDNDLVSLVFKYDDDYEYYTEILEESEC